MKPKININHDAVSIDDALGIDRFQFIVSLALAVSPFLEQGKHKHSKLSERIHDILSYEEILFAATAFAMDSIKKANGDIMEVDFTKTYN